MALNYENLTKTFLHYGFLENPLTPQEVKHLDKLGLDAETAYEIGCDVSCGYDFDQSVDLVVNQIHQHETFEG